MERGKLFQHPSHTVRDLKKSALKNQRGPAAAELMKELWHTDYAALLDSLKTSLLTFYPVGKGVDCTQPFNILFPFSTVPSAQPDLGVIGNAPTPRVSRSNKPGKSGKLQCVPVTAELYFTSCSILYS